MAYPITLILLLGSLRHRRYTALSAYQSTPLSSPKESRAILGEDGENTATN